MKRVTNNPSNYLKYIEIFDVKQMQPKRGELEKMEYPNFPENCWTLDPARFVNSTPYVRFVFHPNPSYSAEIFIEDKLLSLKRADATIKFSKSGTRITTTDHMFNAYTLAIEQEVFDERDENIGCRDYPTELFLSYNHCDRDHWQREIARRFPNLVPVWASNREEETTTHSVFHFGRHARTKYVNIIYGVYSTSGCPRPCKTTKTSARYTF